MYVLDHQALKRAIITKELFDAFAQDKQMLCSRLMQLRIP